MVEYSFKEWGGKLIEHWRKEDVPWLASYYIGFGEPFCFACGWLAPVPDGQPDSWEVAVSKHWLSLAHIAGDEDLPANIAPLCIFCLNQKPEFNSRDEGYRWLEKHSLKRDWFQMYTDSVMQVPPTEDGLDRVENVIKQLLNSKRMSPDPGQEPGR